MTVPLPLSPGRAGFGPDLSLSYDSGNGNGPFGFGWALSLPRILRKTDKGLPRYQDAGESDIFVLSGTEDLVPELQNSALRHEDSVSHPGFVLHRYRPRTEGLFARIERWTQSATGDVHWKVTDRDNVTSVYGRDNRSRVFDPAEAGSAHPRRIFEWLICERYDDKGNAMVFDYVADDARSVDLSRVSEANRSRGAARYLKRVRYGNRVSRLVAPDLSQATWLFEAVFDYNEDHVLAVPPDPARPLREQHRMQRASIDGAADWAARPDPVSRYRSGFEIRQHRRCHRVLMFHRFAELGAEPCLVRALDFDYADRPAGADNDPVGEHAHPGSTRYASFIRSVVQTGFVRDAATPVQTINGRAFVSYLAKSMPPLEFDYSRAAVDDRVRRLAPDSARVLPDRIDGRSVQWVDLDGEGLSGVLARQDGAWRYNANLGDGKFAPQSAQATQPTLFPGGRNRMQLMDLSGDGQLDAVALTEPDPGFYERRPEGGWAAFRPFRLRPTLDFDDPNLRLVDLSGDGRADVLTTTDQGLVWYPSLGEDGFGPPELRQAALPGEAGSRLVLADGTQSVFLADMSGDGLSDLVRIGNGSVWYWPGTGYGTFAPRVTMAAAPHFDHPDQFDPRRLRLVDIDGSGTADIVYLGRAGVDLYFNQSGNGWSARQRLGSAPPVDDPSLVSTVDLLGNGTACLVWTAPGAPSGQSALRYVDLMGGQKPHLLTRAVNNLGTETTIRYAPSTRFYLADKARGRPWITRLPFPVHVVERVETVDRISRNRFVTRYAYHHGHFDGQEREFRGFGMVEQIDTETLGVADEAALAASNLDAASAVAPVLTKTWYHTGAYLGRQHVSDYFAGFVDVHDTGDYFREPGTGDAEARALLLDDTLLPDGLAAEDAPEACRALRGAVLRTEVYALDGTDRETLPYSVREANYALRQIQPRAGNPHGVYMRHARESLVYSYDRQQVPVQGGQIVDAANPAAVLRMDPRVAHTMTLEVDPFGAVRKTASASYPRRFTDPSAPAHVRAEQAAVKLTFTDTAMTNAVDAPNAYRLPLTCETRQFELTGFPATGPGGRYRAADLVAPVAGHPWREDAVFDSELAFEQSPGAGRQRRLFTHSRIQFRRDDLSGALPLGSLESMALPDRLFRLVLTPGLVQQVLNDGGAANRVSDAMLSGAGPVTGARLTHSTDAGGTPDPGWWQPSGQHFFSPGAGDSPAQELAFARQHFFLPHRARDAFHSPAASTEKTVRYDPYDLMVQETADALGNRLTIGERNPDPTQPLLRHGHDYRVLKPVLAMDPNRNRRAFAFDALGFTVGTAVMGKPEDNPAPGDALDAAFAADLTEAQTEAVLADPGGALARQLLGSATMRVVHDPTVYARSAGQPDPQPVVAASIARQTHLPDTGAAGPALQVSLSYSDGFGRVVQTKAQAEPGPVPLRDAQGRIRLDADGQPLMSANPAARRWIGSGWTVYNNKGAPVREFEPFFTDTQRFEFDPRIGQSPWLVYDALDRVVGTVLPDRVWEKTVFGPWVQHTWNGSDTLLMAQPETDADIGAALARLPADALHPTWHALRTDPAHAAAFAARYPDADLRTRQTEAAREAESHAATPQRVHADPLGRAIATVDLNRATGSNGAPPVETVMTDIQVLDIQGNTRAVIDARDRVALRAEFDLLGQSLRQTSLDSGQRLSLQDAAGKTIYAWDDRGHRFRTVHDVLQRPLALWLSEGAGPAEALLERRSYGEAAANPEGNNLRAQLVTLSDQAGTVRNLSFDFKGNLVHSSRQLVDSVTVNAQQRPAYRGRVDWNRAVTLAAETFTSRMRYDALERPVQIVAPHSDRAGAPVNVLQSVYNLAGLPESLHVWMGRASAPTALLDPATTPPTPALGVSATEYDAKGRRLRIDHANGVSSRYTYDGFTFLLTSLVTEDGVSGARLQALDHVHDPMGNVTHIRDSAQQAVFFANARVDPDMHFRYDAVFRLIEATGREHLAQAGSVPVAHGYNDAARIGRAGLPHPQDGQAQGRYLERYSYDAVGNLTAMRHAATDPQHPGWTRQFHYEEPGRIDPAVPCNRLTRTQLGAAAPVVYSAAGDGYDAHGNMLRMPQLSAIEWTEQDQPRMTRRQAVDGADAEGAARQGERTYYVYDGTGQRVRKVTETASGQIKEERIYLGGTEIYRRRTGGLERETLHVMDGGQRIALVETRTQGAEPGVPAQLVRYQFGNHLGSAVLEVDAQRRILSYEEYTPYGSTAYQAVRDQVQVPKRYRFSGMEREEESGLNYHAARYYAPWLARWISADPEGLVDGPNLYAYGRGNPVMYTDRKGTQCDPEQQCCVDAKSSDKPPGFPGPGAGTGSAPAPKWVTANAKVTPEIAAKILGNLAEGKPGFRPELGRVGQASWFISEGNPYTGVSPEATVPVEVKFNVTDAITITSEQLTKIHAEIMAEPGFEAEMEAEYRQKNGIDAEKPLNSGERKGLKRFTKRAAENRMWNKVGQMVRESSSKVGEVILENSEFSKSGNGRFVLTSDPARIQVQPEAVMKGMEKAGLSVAPETKQAADAAVKSGIKQGHLESAAKVRGAFRIGGRILLVVGVAYDAYRIYDAEDKTRTITSVAGGWAGATAMGGAFAAWYTPADAAGPWAWLGHGVGTLVAGGVGYMIGSEVTEQIYEVVVNW